MSRCPLHRHIPSLSALLLHRGLPYVSLPYLRDITEFLCVASVSVPLRSTFVPRTLLWRWLFICLLVAFFLSFIFFSFFLSRFNGTLSVGHGGYLGRWETFPMRMCLYRLKWMEKWAPPASRSYDNFLVIFVMAAGSICLYVSRCRRALYQRRPISCPVNWPV